MKREVGRKKHKCRASGGKVSYRDEESAKAVKGYLRQNPVQDRIPERVYYCDDCDGWHLTSRGDISGLHAERRKGELEL